MESTKIDHTEDLNSFAKLLDIMDELRVKCPWDKKQTMESLRPQTIEETFELSDAIMKGDLHNISKELGDVLLHVVFYAKLGTESGAFTMSDVIENLCNKLVYRHPHVFGDTQVKNAEQVIQNWEQLKTKEKDGNKMVLSGVPDSMPSMIKAYRMQDKARGVGFDWKEKDQVWDKVYEEIGEFKEELQNLSNSKDDGKIEENEYKRAAEGELGDMIFSIINAARLYKLNPDTALEMTCQKFRKRFNYLEEQTIKKGRLLSNLSLEEMDAIWNEAKAQERLQKKHYDK